MKEARQNLLSSLAQKPSGLEWCRAYTQVCDEALRRIWSEQGAGSRSGLALFATGGYGRAELSPSSDLDLTLLSTIGGEDDHLIRNLFKAFQAEIGESAGMTIGYAYRSPSDFHGLDAPSRTSLMEARLIAGDPSMAGVLAESLWNHFPTGDFLIAKIKERNAAMARHHQTPLVTQPHLKEGAGGLRSLQASQWMRMALQQPLLPQSQAYDWLIQLRSLLHLRAGRVMDLLSLQRRNEVAGLLGMTSTELGRQTAEAMDELHHAWIQTLPLLHESTFALTRQVKVSRGRISFGKSATLSDAALACALSVEMSGITMRQAPEGSAFGSGSEVLAALSGGIKAVLAMDEAGVLAQILPEVTGCRYLMPQDEVHQFSVLQHTFAVLEFLESKQMPAFLSEVRASLPDPSLLILAALLHDAGKADASLPHSLVGAGMAQEVGERFGLARPQTDLVVWLVKEHLTLSRIIQVKDVTDPEVLRQAAEACSDVQRLDLLTLLTWADISAVNPEALTPLTLAYLEHLWRAVRQILTEGQEEADPAGLRRRLSRSLSGKADPKEIQAFLDSMPSHYLLTTAPADVPLHLEMTRRAAVSGFEVQMTDRKEVQATEVLVSARDRIGVLRDVLGVLYSLDLRLHAVRACTTQSQEPLVLDLFTVSYGNKCLPPAKAARLEKLLRQVLLGEEEVYKLLRDSGKDPVRQQEYFDLTFKAGQPATLEVKAPRGRGLAYRMANRITKLGWTILGARVGQWAGAGAASFSLLGPQGKGLSQADGDEALGSPHV